MSLRLHALDTVLDVEGPDDLLAALEELWAPAPLRPGAGAARHTVTVDERTVLLDGTPHTPVSDPASLLEAVLVAVNATVLGDCASFAVHAGVVAGPEGATAWPGVSGAGKSTLAAACVRRGLRYVSDEALVLDAQGVRPYGKPLSLSAWSLDALGLPGPGTGLTERAVAASVLGDVVTSPVPLRHLVLLERGAGPATLTPAPPAPLAMHLLTHSFNHYKRPAEAFRLASRAAKDARCWTLRYDSPEAGADLLIELAGGSREQEP